MFRISLRQGKNILLILYLLFDAPFYGIYFHAHHQRVDSRVFSFLSSELAKFVDGNMIIGVKFLLEHVVYIKSTGLP